MSKIYAGIDGLSNSQAVIDWSAWAALRMAAPLELLHALDRHPERAGAQDFSGTLGLDAQAALLQTLSEQDELRGKQLQEAGRELLAAAQARAAAAGVAQLDVRLRHGSFLELAIEMAPDARLIVLGEHHHAKGASRVHLDHQVERVVRGVPCPVLVATGDGFRAPERIVVAFDGSASARRVVCGLVDSPWLHGLPVHLAHVGADTPAARKPLDDARAELQRVGFVAESSVLAGEPQRALPALLKSLGPSLLLMGAYGHSRLRQLIFGSTTSTLLRVSEVPVLVLR
jgi:nucleotide-binding universal stress UspA family protein